MTPLEEKLRNPARTLDTSALEALASKGLLRRAQKDLERGIAVSVIGETENRLKVQVEAFEVALSDAGPAKAQCSCPAAGICQHILAAILHLQEQKGSAVPEEEGSSLLQAENELLGISQEELERWAGKAAFRSGAKMSFQIPAEVSLKGSIVIRFPTSNLQCHYVPGGGLDGIIVGGTAKDERQVVVGAIFAFRKAKGVEWDLPEKVSSVLEESSGSPRSRQEIIRAAEELFTEMLRNGLARLSPPVRERLATLAVSALGVNLPKLSLALRGLSDECSLVLARDARSDLGRFFVRMANTHALCCALQEGGANRRQELVGAHRTQYAEIGNIDLIGVAAWPWETASGYIGLTVVFWDPVAGSWNSWSESRPRHQAHDFHPAARYRQPGPWEGASSPQQVAGSRFRLMNARRNPVGRLSSSGKSRALVTGTTDLPKTNVPVFKQWEEIGKKAASQVSNGLKETNPLNAIVVLQPSEWGSRNFDQVTQTFSWLLLDESREIVPLVLRFTEITREAIRLLESIDPRSFSGGLLAGRIEGLGERMTVYPLSIHQADGTVIHLALDPVKTTTAATQTLEKSVDDEEELTNPSEVESPEMIEPDTAITGFLDEAEDSLLAMAEAGSDSRNLLFSEKLDRLAQRAADRNLEFLANHLRRCSIGNVTPADLLRASYITRLFRQCASLEFTM